MNEKIKNIVVSSLEEINESNAEKIDMSKLDSLVFYGTNGIFSSMGLVNFLSTVEDLIEEEFDVEITLASEKALSRKISPFSGLKPIAEYIYELLEKENVKL